MIRPVRFESNLETAATNGFQGPVAKQAAGDVQRQALAEFDLYVQVLRAAGVNVYVFEDTPEPHTPDSMFPNNWLSFHSPGTVCFYPLLALNRRLEIRPELLSELEQQVGSSWPQREDLSGLCEQEAYLEGTGSMVLDRHNRIAYACLSPRTTLAGLKRFARLMGYELVVFRAFDRQGVAVFHTNVMMGIGSDFALVCLDSIPTETERQRVLNRLAATGHAVIAISLEQMGHFAGNFLALNSRDETPLAVFSTGALRSLDSTQRDEIEKFASIIDSALDTIESHGGGSARCLLAELFD